MLPVPLSNPFPPFLPKVATIPTSNWFAMDQFLHILDMVFSNIPYSQVKSLNYFPKLFLIFNKI